MKIQRLPSFGFDELTQLREQVEGDPKSKNPPGDFNLFTSEARKKLHSIAWAVTNKLKASKEESRTLDDIVARANLRGQQKLEARRCTIR